jgi:hypothetical protein
MSAPSFGRSGGDACREQMHAHRLGRLRATADRPCGVDLDQLLVQCAERRFIRRRSLRQDRGAEAGGDGRGNK